MFPTLATKKRLSRSFVFKMFPALVVFVEYAKADAKSPINLYSPGLETSAIILSIVLCLRGDGASDHPLKPLRIYSLRACLCQEETPARSAVWLHPPLRILAAS